MDGWMNLAPNGTDCSVLFCSNQLVNQVNPPLPPFPLSKHPVVGKRTGQGRHCRRGDGDDGDGQNIDNDDANGQGSRHKDDGVVVKHPRRRQRRQEQERPPKTPKDPTIRPSVPWTTAKSW
ncbi:hypothetical protein [Mollivirus kamchatka]|nr:hypothetical protein [Mollivirus kamchatka]